MALQATHKDLKCSHEKLVDSYASLEIAHEVPLTLVKFLQPPRPACTCSHVNNEFSCTKPCCYKASQSSIEHVLVEYYDDLIAQENDELKQEVEELKTDLTVLKEKGQVKPSQDNHENMVKKLEKGSTVISSTPQLCIKTNKSKSPEKKTGHFTSQCSTKLKAQEALSKKQRSSIGRRLCYQYKEKDHLVADFPQVSSADQGQSDHPPRVVRSGMVTTAKKLYSKEKKS
jgi:hypothetical protein